MKGLAVAPPGMGCIMGVSTSRNPLFSRKERIPETTALLFLNTSLTSGLAIRSR
jgi:hypothetical protein